MIAAAALTRCACCHGTGNEPRHFAPSRRTLADNSLLEQPARVLVRCRACNGRGYSRPNKPLAVLATMR